jgi:hypothetical protein
MLRSMPGKCENGPSAATVAIDTRQRKSGGVFRIRQGDHLAGFAHAVFPARQAVVGGAQQKHIQLPRMPGSLRPLSRAQSSAMS